MPKFNPKIVFSRGGDPRPHLIMVPCAPAQESSFYAANGISIGSAVLAHLYLTTNVERERERERETNGQITLHR